MRKHRRFDAQGLVELDLLGRVVQVIITAYHVGHLHRHVIDYNYEIVEGVPIRANYDLITEFFVLEYDIAADQVAHCGLAI